MYSKHKINSEIISSDITSIGILSAFLYQEHFAMTLNNKFPLTRFEFEHDIEYTVIILWRGCGNLLIWREIKYAIKSIHQQLCCYVYSTKFEFSNFVLFINI